VRIEDERNPDLEPLDEDDDPEADEELASFKL
jgi:hypothetical protein